MVKIKNFNKNLVGVLQLLSLGGSSYAYFMGSLASNQEALSNINAVN